VTTTIGVEEEFLLLDPDTGENAPVAEKALAALSAQGRELSRLEFRHSMIEMATPVCGTLPELRQCLTDARRMAAEAAESSGARLVAVGATPVAEPYRTPTDKPRFHQIAEYYGPAVDHPSVCGCHVHVGVPDRALAVEICTRLRGWLPVIQALSVNSPFHEGADSGYASWRSIQLERWPSLGPWPHVESPEDYERVMTALVSSGLMLDRSLELWYARPSTTFPTVEVRVTDVCPAVDDTVLIAGLVRALVSAVRDDIDAGRPAGRIPDDMLRAAHWNAARSGIAGTLFDPRSARPRPAWDLVEELVAVVDGALRRHGDRDEVHAGLGRIRREGTGADRQRRAFREAGLPGVLEHLADLTVGPRS
jgi:glutamate---cysteine ligase / carboxylate-amine ligase